eukprot:11239-Heterococcus_DN1.PRE.2
MKQTGSAHSVVSQMLQALHAQCTAVVLSKQHKRSFARASVELSRSAAAAANSTAQASSKLHQTHVCTRPSSCAKSQLVCAGMCQSMLKEKRTI